MSFFPRFPTGEFAPLFRLLDDYASHQQTRDGDSGFGNISQLRSFQPRFDVKEVKDAYELHGELPGVDQKDIQIEFTDHQTLSVKGRTERHRESGAPPAAIEGQEKARITSASESEASTPHYQKPSVEDEPSTSGAVPSEQPAKDQQVATTNQQQEVEKPQRPSSRYWVSERSVGEFSRSFAFPTRVDQDNVKASLKNGILSIVVPKASAPTLKRINIE